MHGRDQIRKKPPHGFDDGKEMAIMAPHGQNLEVG